MASQNKLCAWYPKSNKILRENRPFNVLLNTQKSFLLSQGNYVSSTVIHLVQRTWSACSSGKRDGAGGIHWYTLEQTSRRVPDWIPKLGWSRRGHITLAAHRRGRALLSEQTWGFFRSFLMMGRKSETHLTHINWKMKNCDKRGEKNSRSRVKLSILWNKSKRHRSQKHKTWANLKLDGLERGHRYVLL